MGTRVALDDVTFAGAANLAVLARANFSSIKLDKSLIDQIGPESPAPAWLETVKVLLESTALRVIAEGVETEYQLGVLSAAKVQAAQGFYFSRPAPGGGVPGVSSRLLRNLARRLNAATRFRREPSTSCGAAVRVKPRARLCEPWVNPAK
jgi:EAL domain-containing protein (putative c-di-GMP-specific phosphodiesterase class I)